MEAAKLRHSFQAHGVRLRAAPTYLSPQAWFSQRWNGHILLDTLGQRVSKQVLQCLRLSGEC